MISVLDFQFFLGIMFAVTVVLLIMVIYYSKAFINIKNIMKNSIDKNNLLINENDGLKTELANKMETIDLEYTNIDIKRRMIEFEFASIKFKFEDKNIYLLNAIEIGENLLNDYQTNAKFLEGSMNLGLLKFNVFKLKLELAKKLYNEEKLKNALDILDNIEIVEKKYNMEKEILKTKIYFKMFKKNGDVNYISKVRKIGNVDILAQMYVMVREYQKAYDLVKFINNDDIKYYVSASFFHNKNDFTKAIKLYKKSNLKESKDKLSSLYFKNNKYFEVINLFSEIEYNNSFIILSSFLALDRYEEAKELYLKFQSKENKFIIIDYLQTKLFIKNDNFYRKEINTFIDYKNETSLEKYFIEYLRVGEIKDNNPLSKNRLQKSLIKTKIVSSIERLKKNDIEKYKYPWVFLEIFELLLRYSDYKNSLMNLLYVLKNIDEFSYSKLYVFNNFIKWSNKFIASNFESDEKTIIEKFNTYFKDKNFENEIILKNIFKMILIKDYMDIDALAYINDIETKNETENYYLGNMYYSFKLYDKSKEINNDLIISSKSEDLIAMALVLRSKIYLSRKAYEYALFDLKNASERKTNKCYFDVKYLVSYIYYEIYIDLNMQNKKRIPNRTLIGSNERIYFFKALEEIELTVKEMGGINYKILNLYLKLKRVKVSMEIKLKVVNNIEFLINSKDKISDENIKILRNEYSKIKLIIDDIISMGNTVKFDSLDEEYLLNKKEFYKEYKIVKLYGRKRKNGNVIDLNY